MEKEIREDEVSISCSTLSTQSSSHHHALTSRRNEHTPWPRHRQLIKTSHLLLLVFLTCCLSFTSASSVYIEESMVEVEEHPVDTPETFQESLDRLARTGTILVDPRPPPIPNPKAWTLATENDDLRRRSLDDLKIFAVRQVGDDENDSKDSSSSSMTTTSLRPSSTKGSSSKGSSTVSSGLVAQTTAASTSLPTPFDNGFANNITESCSNFMYGFLTNATFHACLPFSLLLQVRPLLFPWSKPSLPLNANSIHHNINRLKITSIHYLIIMKSPSLLI